MGSYTIPVDLRAWVEATAPTLTRDDWRSLEAFRDRGYRHPGKWTREQARALLAYADEVAAGFIAAQQIFAGFPDAGVAIGPHRTGLQAALLVVSRKEHMTRDGIQTDWGRFIAGRAAALRGGEISDEAAAAKSAMVPAPDDVIAVASSPIPDGPPEHPEGGGAGAPSLSGDARSAVTVGAVVCPAHGRVPLSERSYDAQMSQPNAGWYCPECGERAEWDDDVYEEHLEAMRDAESASTQARAIEAIRHANARRVDMFDELLCQWKLEGDGPLLSLIERDDLDQVWAVLRAVAACPDLVAAVNNVAQILVLRETQEVDDVH